MSVLENVSGETSESELGGKQNFCSVSPRLLLMVVVEVVEVMVEVVEVMVVMVEVVIVVEEGVMVVMEVVMVEVMVEVEVEVEAEFSCAASGCSTVMDGLSLDPGRGSSSVLLRPPPSCPWPPPRSHAPPISAAPSVGTTSRRLLLSLRRCYCASEINRRFYFCLEPPGAPGAPGPLLLFRASRDQDDR